VLVEKPMALGLDEARALLASTAGSKLVRLVGLNYRFHPLVRALRRVLERGDVGRPLAVMCTMATAPNQKISVTRYESDPERGGGVFHDSVVHTVDVLRFVLGSEVVACRATASSRMAAHDLATVELVFGTGVHVAGFFSKGTSSDCSFVVMGEEGRAEINLARPFGLALHRRFDRSRYGRYWAYVGELGRVWTGARLSSPSGRLISYRDEWRHFLACIARGEPGRPDFEDGVETTRVVTELIRSAEGGSADAV
jgi:predicted dehydrogenase